MIISGAGSVIGKGLANPSAAEEYRVIVTDVLVEEGHQIAESLKQDGATAEFRAMEVSDIDQVMR